jgi:hypothetical protein
MEIILLIYGEKTNYKLLPCTSRKILTGYGVLCRGWAGHTVSGPVTKFRAKFNAVKH